MRHALVIAAVVGASIVVGCSGEDSTRTAAAPTSSSTSAEQVATTDTGESTSVTAAPATAPTSEPTAAAPVPEAVEPSGEELVGSRVRAFFEVREAANGGPRPNPGDPALAEVAAGEALAAMVAETQQRLDGGLGIRAGEQALAEIRVGTARFGGDTAEVAVCSIDDGVIYEVATGAVVDDDVVTHSYLFDLELVDDQWRVVRVVRLQRWEGVAGCALAPGDFPY
ncbi:MAG: hypothetical protein S0880_37010 [Actinomycetota bacterium]|nr:hypothetical protein [Actinomycetota bacterium]